MFFFLPGVVSCLLLRLGSFVELYAWRSSCLPEHPVINILIKIFLTYKTNHSQWSAQACLSAKLEDFPCFQVRNIEKFLNYKNRYPLIFKKDHNWIQSVKQLSCLTSMEITCGTILRTLCLPSVTPSNFQRIWFSKALENPSWLLS